jgi:uncharacterized protein YbjT (DUF2867 family)
MSVGDRDVVIAGGHGKVARRLTRRLAAHDDRVRALIRKPEHVADVEADGAEAVVCDLATAAIAELAEHIADADTVVFAAGAGPGSTRDAKWVIDAGAAIRLVEAAKVAGVDRYLMLSSIGAEDPPQTDDAWGNYLRAKAYADRVLRASDRAWTIVRPVFMNDEPGRARVEIDCAPLEGEVTRDDVAATLYEVVHRPATAHLTIYVAAGDKPVEDAIAAVLTKSKELL